MARKNRYNQVLELLPETLEWSLGRDITEMRDFLLADDSLPRIFLGSGGSNSAAQLAMQLSVERGITATAMTPYQYACSAWSKLPAKVFLFSAGGRNVDALNAFRTANANPDQEFGVMLMSTPTRLEQLMDEAGAGNKFIFKMEHRDCFLATNSLVAVYSLLFRIFRGDKVRLTDWSFTEEIGDTLKSFIETTYNLTTDEWGEHDAALYGARETDRFYLLYPADALPVAVDLESRFAEGSIGCLQISDYRNFAHGRFNWFDQRKGQTAILAIVTPKSKGVVESILAELPKEIPVMRISTELAGSAGTMELLLKGMHIAKHLGLRWGLDIGAPDVAEFGKVIHRLDFIPD